MLLIPCITRKEMMKSPNIASQKTELRREWPYEYHEDVENAAARVPMFEMIGQGRTHFFFIFLA